jgi:hypothetical protein
MIKLPGRHACPDFEVALYLYHLVPSSIVLLCQFLVPSIETGNQGTNATVVPKTSKTNVHDVCVIYCIYSITMVHRPGWN